jgi:hypothetical protein
VWCRSEGGLGFDSGLVRWRNTKRLLKRCSVELQRKKKTDFTSEVSPLHERSLLVMWAWWVVELPLASRGGEGRKPICTSSSASSRWRSRNWQQNQASYAWGASASTIYCRKDGTSRRHVGMLFNLQFGGPYLNFLPEPATFCCQVVRPRQRKDARRLRLSADEGD